MRVNEPTVFLSTVFDTGLHEPLRAASPGLIWDPRIYVQQDSSGTIEGVCRELIRKSRLFVGVFDERGGHAPFEEGIAPVTVLEIELLQALFQRMPIYLFLLPGFERNTRLAGLVALARREGLAVVRTCPTDIVDIRDAERRELTSRGIAMITNVIHDPVSQRLVRTTRAFVRRIHAYRHLDVSLLSMPAAVIADPFREAEVERHLKRASLQADHAATLAYLWPALRQLSGVPYNDSRFAIHRPAWETLAGVWDRSASWYGLHNDTPIGKLAAVNTLLWIRAAGTPSHIEPGFARGARASAFYSMAKRLWTRSPRRKLFLRALDEVQYAVQASPKRRSGYLAIRGSVHLKLGRVSAAIADYEAAVAERLERGDSASSQGEAWVELGWGYLRALRIRQARHALRHGLALMRQDFQRNPTLRPDFLIRALLKHALASALMFDFKEARISAHEGCRLAHERVAFDQLSGIRGRLCRWFTR